MLHQFAVVFAALIHDVGHIGVPNSQLVEEEDRAALKYKNQSVAEQNSIAMAWQLLMEPRYARLRSFIYKTNIERKLFRQVIVNTVLATDISDRSLHVTRKQRWERAFHNNSETPDAIRNYRATVVLESLIQMADVSHTMQRWSVYHRWNEHLFQEMLAAYHDDRAAFDPTETWYQGEIGFFDYYVIPLATRMTETGVFGEVGATFVSNANNNRSNWEMIGHSILADMICKARPPLKETSDDASADDGDNSELAKRKKRNSDDSSAVEIDDAFFFNGR
jgi:hypothetical protein